MKDINVIIEELRKLRFHNEKMGRINLEIRKVEEILGDKGINLSEIDKIAYGNIKNIFPEDEVVRYYMELKFFKQSLIRHN